MGGNINLPMVGWGPSLSYTSVQMTIIIISNSSSISIIIIITIVIVEYLMYCNPKPYHSELFNVSISTDEQGTFSITCSMAISFTAPTYENSNVW